MTARRREYALLLACVLAVAAVGTLGLHRAGLYALPGDRVVAWFPPGVDTPEALRRIGRAGAVVAATGPLLPGLYRVHVLDAAAPRRLAERAWVLREPVDGLAQCFGLDTGGPVRTAAAQ